jgi:hypothetical protein
MSQLNVAGQTNGTSCRALFSGAEQHPGGEHNQCGGQRKQPVKNEAVEPVHTPRHGERHPAERWGWTWQKEGPRRHMVVTGPVGPPQVLAREAACASWRKEERPSPARPKAKAKLRTGAGCIDLTQENLARTPTPTGPAKGCDQGRRREREERTAHGRTTQSGPECCGPRCESVSAPPHISCGLPVSPPKSSWKSGGVPCSRKLH